MVVFAVVLTAATSTAEDRDCLPRDGRCMDVKVNGQKALELSDGTRSALAGMPLPRSFDGRVSYEVPAPIKGDLDVKVERSARSKEWFGENRSFKISVVPLSDVKLDAHSEIGTSDDVRIEGAAPVVVKNVLEGSRLPPGPYLLLIRLRGDSNWDEMTLFLEVTE